MNRNVFTSIATMIGALALASAAQAAPLSNGDLGNGLSGWTTAGDATVAQGSLFNELATGNTPRLVLGTGSLFQDDFPLGAGHYNLSGHDTVSAGLALEASVGLAAGALDDADNGNFVLEGSSASQTFSVRGGDNLPFHSRAF